MGTTLTGLLHVASDPGVPFEAECDQALNGGSQPGQIAAAVTSYSGGGNVDVSGGLPVINTYQVLEGDRVLLAQQDDGTQNGLWIAHAASPWVRPPEWAHGATIGIGTLIFTGTNGAPWAYGYLWTFGASVVDTSDPQLYYFLDAYNLFRNAAGHPQFFATLDMDGNPIIGLPTSDPAVAGALWNNAGTPAISAG